MPRFSADRWLAGRRQRSERRDPFTQIDPGDLDVQMPPPYDTSDSKQQAARARIEALVGKLQPNGLDAGSREVLNNLINAVADQEVARLEAERDERQAVGDLLIGLAKKQVARHRPKYDEDFLAMRHAHHALGVAFKALTGKEIEDLGTPYPRKVDNDPVGSSFGPVDLSESWFKSDHAAAGQAPPSPAADKESGAPGKSPPSDPSADGPSADGPSAGGLPDDPVIGRPWSDGRGGMPPVNGNRQTHGLGADAVSDPYGGSGPDER
jgi:hypothetical protein